MNRLSTDSSGRIVVDTPMGGEGSSGAMAAEIRDGLTSSPKRLPPKYFYDDEGSELFEQITCLQEYYPTRAERALLEDIAPELMASLEPAEIVELGSGSSSKTRTLLRAPAAANHLRRYIPFDVSEGIVRSSAEELVDEFPYLSVHGVIGDFERDLGRIPKATGRRLVLFLGGTIGNFDPGERARFLSSAASTLMGSDDRLLIGMDLVKDVPTIEAAYNDAQGVTAAFNLNVLRVLNRELGANFDLDAYAHQAFFNEEASRIEMHLVPASRQDVSVGGIGLNVTVEPTETIWTECSYKFTRASAETALAVAGLRIDRFFTNDEPGQLFGLVLAATI